MLAAGGVAGLSNRVPQVDWLGSSLHGTQATVLDRGASLYDEGDRGGRNLDRLPEEVSRELARCLRGTGTAAVDCGRSGQGADFVFPTFAGKVVAPSSVEIEHWIITFEFDRCFLGYPRSEIIPRPRPPHAVRPRADRSAPLTGSAESALGRLKMPIGKITPSMLNAMSVEDRVKALNELFPAMDIWAAQHISYFRWNRRTLIRTTAMSNASCFFIGFLDRLFLVTAAHVYDGYTADKAKSGKTNIVCHIENIVFDPEARLRGYNRDLDIATFEFSYDDLMKIGKQAIPGSPWPPPEPIPELAIWFGGFPGISRLWLRSNAVSFGLCMGHVPITTVTDRQITCRFDREQFVSVETRRTAPPGMDMGGMSGGPLLLPLGTEEGEWHFCLGGVICEARSGTDFETVVAVRAHFVNPDGSISRI